MSSKSRAPSVSERVLSLGPRLREAVAVLRRGGAVPSMRDGLAYGAGVVGVALVTAAVGVAQGTLHVGNLSLLYLLVVLWLAATFGRGPAVLASVLAVAAYDYFFIPPLHRLTVDDPGQWLELLALLATALVLGQMTAAVQARARDARESQQRTATLYELSQLIASTTAYDTLLAALAGRVVDVFAASGVAACSLVVADEQGLPAVRAAATVSARPAAARAVRMEGRDQRAQAALVLERGTAAGGQIAGGGGGSGTSSPGVCFFVPLRSRGRVVGALGIAGEGTLRGLVGAARPRRSDGRQAGEYSGADGQAGLFDAFCEQIALALDRAALQEQAIHAEALRESDRLKDALLGSVTHDLRTPLASIKAAAESLLGAGATWAEEDRRDLLESIDASADRLNRLVENLLDLSRLEAGVAPPEREWYLIGDVVATVLDRLELAGSLRGRTVRVEIPEDVPLVPMDHAQIEQVLTNVLENALKYSPMDSPVEVRAQVVTGAGTGAAPGELEVRVRDQGIGVPPHELRAIFGKFYRVQQIRAPWGEGKPPAGTGLGLAISDAIIRAHGGRIWAESTPGAGTTVAFTLPIPEDAPRGGLPELPGAEKEPNSVVSGPDARSEVAP